MLLIAQQLWLAERRAQVAARKTTAGPGQDLPSEPWTPDPDQPWQYNRLDLRRPDFWPFLVLSPMLAVLPMMLALPTSSPSPRCSARASSGSQAAWARRGATHAAHVRHHHGHASVRVGCRWFRCRPDCSRRRARRGRYRLLAERSIRRAHRAWGRTRADQLLLMEVAIRFAVQADGVTPSSTGGTRRSRRRAACCW